jgi:hypothetical protein
MRRLLLSWAAAAAILAIPAGSWAQGADTKPAPAQQAPAGSADNSRTASSTVESSAPETESLADAARKAREAKKDQPKPARVFDNDNIPGGTVSTVGKTQDAKKDGDDANSDDKSKSGTDSEKAWKEKFAMLRSKLARDKEDLEVMQRELGVLNLQNYSDPNKGLQQELTRSDINNKTAAIDAKQKAIEADQQAIDDAEDDLRKSGGDSGWAR